MTIDPNQKTRNLESALKYEGESGNGLDIDDIFKLSQATLSHFHRLQSSAMDVLGNHQKTKLEVESRELALHANITKMADDCETCLIATADIRSKLNEATDSNLQLISNDLQLARDTLTERQEGVKGVMLELSRIGQQLSMLAMNAKIEASRAGKSEAGFSVVADEVKRLAKDAVRHHSQAADMFDLTSVNALMIKSVETFQQSHNNTEVEIGNAFDEIKSAISNVGASLGEVSEHHSVISEVTQENTVAVETAYQKIVWCRDRVKLASDAFQGSSFASTAKQLVALLKLDSIKHSPSYDRYQDIKARGVIRIAIEPNLIGLSFRREGSTEFIGLDVEYATALAEFLGVRCEFVEVPWDTLTQLLYIGPRANEAPADIVLSGLPPSGTYDSVAYSETYTYLHWVLARRVGDAQINGIADLQGKTLGIINDPGAFELLASIGVRWQSNKDLPGGKIFLKNLIAYSDQSRIHDCLVEGVVDAFGVDLPVYHWACTNAQSPWHGKIEICSDNLPESPYYYVVAVAAVPESYKLLCEVNAFIAEFTPSAKRKALEEKWQGNPVIDTLSYRDEEDNMIGAPELRHVWEAQQRQLNASAEYPKLIK